MLGNVVVIHTDFRCCAEIGDLSKTVTRSHCSANVRTGTCMTPSIESPDNQASFTIPPEYKDLGTVFSKTKDSGLPPYRPYDYAIELLTWSMPPCNRIYLLSLTEQEAMEEYIQEALKQGYIWPATSPVSAGFFLVEKKVGGLRPCIDKRGLNQCTVKYSYYNLYSLLP